MQNKLKDNNDYIDKLEKSFKEEIHKSIMKEQELMDHINRLQISNDKLASSNDQDAVKIDQLNNSKISSEYKTITCKY